ncbi:MAG TPA: hypothetical protein VEA79_11430, partial [Phenylobacterium sp.]|nr:hypothetical protein [Phenylobacterium sp.]
SLAHGADDLFVLDLATRRERALTDDGWKAAGFTWSADSRHIFFSSNRGGAFGLWTVDTHAGGPPRQVSTGLGGVTFSRMSSDAQNRLAVEIPHGRVTLSRLGPSGGATDIASSADSLWDPAVGPDGAVAYIAGASGAPEVWVAEPDGRISRLTSLVASLLSRPAWSVDGQTIAFLGVKGRQPQIYTVRRDGSQLRAVTSDTTDKYDPAMMADGRIAYIERGPSGWRAMSVAPGAAPQPLPGGDGWRSLRAGPDGRLYGTRNGGNTVLALGAPRAVADVTGADNWAVGPAGVYFVRQRPERRGWAIWLQPWSGPAREAADFPDAAHSLAVDPDGALYITQVRDDQIDLGLLSLTQGR